MATYSISTCLHCVFSPVLREVEELVQTHSADGCVQRTTLDEGANVIMPESEIQPQIKKMKEER